MIPYTLYSALILTSCFLFYKLFLQKETFFQLNRFVLLFCMLLAFILPLLPIPQQLSFRKTPIEMPNPISETFVKQIENAKNATKTNEKTNENVDKNVNEKATLLTNIEQINQMFDIQQVIQWLAYFYWFGVVVFGLNFLMQLVVLLYRAYSMPVIEDGKFRIVEIAVDKAPCSFANNIFINPEKYDWETYNQILLHEKIHIEQKHTLDILFAEMVIIFQWFNPFAWQWRKIVENNLEFFTDNQLLQNNSVKKENYQLSLLKVSAPHFPLNITTNYNQSLLKQRLVMMNTKKSNVHTTWKYFFLLPMLVVFVCFFNEPVAQSQTIVSNNNTENQAFETKNIETKGDDDSKIITSGNWFGTIKEEKINIQFKYENDENSSSNSSFKLSEFKDLVIDKANDKKGTFSLTREAGTIEFFGKFEGNKGMGEYKFIANKTYKDAMEKEGISNLYDINLMTFFMLNINTSYVQMLKKNGYNKISKDDLIPLAALKIDETYISSMKEAGLKNIELDDLIPLKSLNIDKAYIDEIHNAGYKEITLDKLIALKSQGIDGKYISNFQSANKTDKGDMADDIIAFKSMNIDDKFVNSFKELGYTNISGNDAIALKSQNITADYVKSFQKIGYENITLNDIIAVKSMDIDDVFINSFKKLGYRDISINDVIALKSQNITANLFAEYKELGFKDLGVNDIIGAVSTETTPAFIKSMRAKGHNLKDLQAYITLKSVLENN